MLNKKDFESLHKEFDDFDKAREELIKKSRDVIKLSKQVINAVHRGQDAKKFVDSINKEYDNLNKIVAKNAKLGYQGSYKAAVMEYVEAILYYEFVVFDKISSHKDLGVSGDHYLLGIADLTGEMMRKAILDATHENYASVLKIRDSIDEIHATLSQFDFRDNEVRRKYDSIKYDLKKIEDLILELKLKDKI